MTKKQIKAIAIGVIALVVIAFSGMLFEDVDTKKIVVNQVPISGKIEVWSTPGLKVQLFGNTTSYDKAKLHWFSQLKNEGGKENTSCAIKFNDGSMGSISGSVMVRMPLTQDKMTIINNECGSMAAVMSDIVTPNINKVIFASGALMSPFEAYAEKRNDLIYYINDQLMYGVYKTTITEFTEIDSVTNTKKVIKIAERISNPNAPGGYERQETSAFDYFGIQTSQLAISDIDFDDKVKAQIAKQQESNMSIETAVIEAKAAQQRLLKATAEGQADTEKAKWEQERIKIVEITKAEQEAEVARLHAEKQFKVAEFEAKKANEVAKKIVAEGKAQAEANKMKVIAGLIG